MHARARRAARSAVALLGVAALGGCGDDADHANTERPPSSITVTAAVADGRISVSPRRFSAGPVRLIVSNQTGTVQAITFATGGKAAGITQTTPPIRPAGTGTLEVDATEGDYEISADGRGIAPTPVRVGAPRPSAQNQLLLP